MDDEGIERVVSVAQTFSDAAREAGYAEGYRAGWIAALREVGCTSRWVCDPKFSGSKCADQSISRSSWCDVCRLLADAESGEDTGEVGE